ncbi:MAG TPA: ABC transporter ATP-binding protein [Actinomycetota bacterium]|nr:ABC transporter ATP-binding protein [Actinomycetota bacterium]
MAEVGFRDVTKVFRDGTVAVSSFDLDVPDRTFCVLVGPSGSGKTTLLRMVAGLEEPTEGSIWIGGRDVTDDAPKHRDVAMVFQNFAIYPHMSVLENIAFGLRMRGIKRREIGERVVEAARLLGLEDVLKKRPRHLSTGQLQRVAMGRAIVRRPALFLMDEPLSNLDARLREQMRAEIVRIHRTVAATTLYVTHDQAEAMTLGDLVAVIKDGELQQADTPEEIYERPTNVFVAAFVGSPAMNLVEATLERGDGLWGRFGRHRIRLDDGGDVSALRRYEDRQVILGIRPEHLDDASLVSRDVPPGTTIRTVVARHELIGPEVLLRFNVDAPLLMLRDPRASDEDPDAGMWAVERPNMFVARVDAGTRARDGADVELAVRTDRIHLFDPATGLAIGD